jgi:hypothetical protein
MRAVGIAAAFALLVPSGAAAPAPAGSAAILVRDQERAPPRRP